MGKRKSSKPQKYIKQSDDEEDNHSDFFDLEIDLARSLGYAVMPTTSKIEEAWKRDWHHSTKDPVKSVWQNQVDKDYKSEWSTKQEKIENGSDDGDYIPTHFVQKKANKSLNSAHISRGRQKKIIHQDSVLPESSVTPFEEIVCCALKGTLIQHHQDQDLKHDRSDEEGKTKRRRKYVTYPATFRLEVVEFAEKNGKSAAAKKYNICVEKVSMWCKTKDNIVHKVKKSGICTNVSGEDNPLEPRVEDHDILNCKEIKTEDMDDKEQDKSETDGTSEQDSMNTKSDDQGELTNQTNVFKEEPETFDLELTNKSETLFSPAFKLRVVESAEQKGKAEAAKEYGVSEKRVALWCKAKYFINEKLQKSDIQQWEIDLYVGLKSCLDKGQNITVEDILQKAKKIHCWSTEDKEESSMAWLINWCKEFKVCFNSSADSIPQPLTGDTCLILETSAAPTDREEVIATCSKRRRRSYTLAFKLEVIKFAQSNTKHATSRQFGIARRVISRWIADKDVLENELLNSSKEKEHGTWPFNDDLDREVWEWYRDLKNQGKEVTKEEICAHAISLFRSMGHPEFSANNGWFKQWQLRWKDVGEEVEDNEDADSDEMPLPNKD